MRGPAKRFNLLAAAVLTAVLMSAPSARAGFFGDDAEEVDKLIEALYSQTQEDVQRAREKLLAMKKSVVVPRLIEAVDEPGKQHRVVPIIVDMGEEAVRPLVELLKSRVPLFERWKRGLEQRTSSAVTMPLLMDEFQQQRNAAAVALITIGEAAVRSVVELLDYKHDIVRAYAAKILGKIGDTAAVEPLIKALSDSFPPVRWNAAWSLGRIGHSMAAIPLIEAFDEIKQTEAASAAGAAAGGPPQFGPVAFHGPETRTIIVAAVVGLDHPRVFKFLVETLKDTNPSVRTAAVEALGDFRTARALRYAGSLPEPIDPRLWNEAFATMVDERPVEHIVGMLEDRVPAVRYEAAFELARIEDARAIPQLIGALESGWRAGFAARYLGKIGGESVVAPLVAALGDNDGDTRAAAAASLGGLGDARAVAPLVAVLADKDDSVRRSAITSLARLGDERAVLPVAGLVADPQYDVRKAAIRALGDLGDVRALEHLVKALKDQSEYCRREAAASLGKLGDPGAALPLVAAMKDEDRAVMRGAAAALQEIRAPEAVEGLLVLLEDQKKGIREAAAKTLGKIGDARALSALAEAVKDEEPDVRKAAVWGIRDIEDDRREQILVEFLSSSDEALVASAIAALRDMKESANVEALEPACTSEDPQVRWRAAKVLSPIKTRQATDLLIKMLPDGDGKVRRRAIWSLEERKDPRITGVLIPVMEESDLETRRAAAWVLSEYGDPAVFDTFVKTLEDPDAGLRRAAAAGLGNIGEKRAAKPLVAALEDSDPYVRWEAAMALSMVGGREEVSVLLGAFDGRTFYETAAIAFALESLGGPEALAAVRELVRPVKVTKAAEDYLRYIRRSANDDIPVLSVALARHGDMEMAEAVYWSNQNGLKRTAECWARKRGVLDRLVASKDSGERPKWRPPRETYLARKIRQLKEGKPPERAFAAGSLGRFFGDYAPRQGAPTFQQAKTVVPVPMGDPLESPRGEQSLEAMAEVGGFAGWEMERKFSREHTTVEEVKEALAAVIEALNDPEPSVRAEAAEAIGRTREPSVIEPLSRALGDGDTKVRQAAAISLGRIRSDLAAEVLSGALHDKDASVRAEAAWMLGYQGRRRSVAPLLAMLKDPDESVAAAAIEALGKIGDARTFDRLLGCLKRGPEELRQAAATALGNIDDPRRVPSLREALADRSAKVFTAAARALAELGSDEALAALDGAVEMVDLAVVFRDYRDYVKTGDEADERLLILALIRHGHHEMAVDFYWSGNETLKYAAGILLDNPPERYMQAEFPDRPGRPKWGAKKK